MTLSHTHTYTTHAYTLTHTFSLALPKVLTLLGDHFAVEVGGNAAHVVVDSGQNGDGLFGQVDAREDLGCLADTGQPLVEDVSGDVWKIQKHVILVFAYV